MVPATPGTITCSSSIVTTFNRSANTSSMGSNDPLSQYCPDDNGIAEDHIAQKWFPTEIAQRFITAKIRLAFPSSMVCVAGKLSKSPRMAFNAYRSESISLAVRKPNRRKNGTGGHQPCTACCNRNPATIAGSRNNRRLMNVPSPSPNRAIEAAFASNVRSMSHSWSRSSSRRLIS